MNKFARVDNGIVVEIIESLVDSENNEVPIQLQYTSEFINTLVDISNVANPPLVGYCYADGQFVEVTEQKQLLTKEQAEALRLIAYSNPVTGSDRYFSESIALQAEGFSASSVEVKEAKSKGLARKIQIQELYSYPIT